MNNNIIKISFRIKEEQEPLIEVAHLAINNKMRTNQILKGYFISNDR